MEATFTKTDDYLIVTPVNSLETGNSPEVQTEIAERIGEGEKKIIINLGQADYVSSAGLRVVLATVRLLEPQKGKTALCNANDQILEVLEISGFHTFVKHFNSLEEAIEYVIS